MLFEGDLRKTNGWKLGRSINTKHCVKWKDTEHEVEVWVHGGGTITKAEKLLLNGYGYFVFYGKLIIEN